MSIQWIGGAYGGNLEGMIAEHPDSRGRQHVIGALPVEPSQHGDPHASTTVSTIADAVPVEYRQAYLEGMLAVARENDG